MYVMPGGLETDGERRYRCNVVWQHGSGDCNLICVCLGVEAIRFSRVRGTSG